MKYTNEQKEIEQNVTILSNSVTELTKKVENL